MPAPYVTYLAIWSGHGAMPPVGSPAPRTYGGTIWLTGTFMMQVSSSLVFHMPSAYLPGSTQVSVQGITMRLGIDYTESDPVGDPNALPYGGSITFMSPLSSATTPPGFPVTINVQYVQNGPMGYSAFVNG